MIPPGLSPREKVHFVMHEFKHGGLHSGSHTGPVVRDRQQAIAIALKQAGLSRNKRRSRGSAHYRALGD